MENSPPRHILFATDFSARCDRAKVRTIQLALPWHARLTVIHVIEDDDAPFEQPEDIVARIVRFFDLARDRPSTTCFIADTMLLDAFGERRPMRCLGFTPGATEQEIVRCYPVVIRATATVRQEQRGSPPSLRDSDRHDGNGIAYIHKTLFRLDR